MPTALTNEDLRTRARRRIPRAMFDYVDRGSYDEVTLAANRRAFERHAFRQRVMVDVSQRDLRSEMLGEPTALPLALGPTGLTGLVHADGEIHACRAAHAAGVPYCLSTASICSIEDVRAAVDRPFWFQLYIMRDRGFVAALIERARVAGCPVLVVTVDLAAQGQRHQDFRNGLSVPPRLTVSNLLDMLARPAWVARMLLGKRKTFGNFAGHLEMGSDVGAITQWINAQFDSSLSWKDLDWLRARWPGKLVVKGVMDAEDACEAMARGADAVVVSNHGGRQLDGAPATLDALPAIAQALQGQAELFLDGGVRSGQDIVKALALGADGCWLGRAFLYGLAADGEAGVSRSIEIVRREIDTTLALLGRPTVRGIDRSVLL
ncbi:MAG: alpha-hydroxy-acid oxidizing protein [Lysobacteraceae bacterium]|nr:MAG: alpha-hydroxy-acid oxidizing protein [Xanthomonadaceae bacterium]